MRPLLRTRLLLLLAGTGALLAGLPSSAVTSPSAGREGSSPRLVDARALTLLERATEASQRRSWSGVQHVVSIRDGQPTLAMLEVTHRAGRGSAVHDLAQASSPAGEGSDTVAVDAVDPGLLSLLVAHYDLVLAGDGACAGHQADVVEARRPGASGEAAVAGRFWIDRSNGLVLRRDLMDASGAVVRSAAYVRIEAAVPVRPLLLAAQQPLQPNGEVLDLSGLIDLEESGWPVSLTLPGGLDLFHARWHEADQGEGVLQTSYSDGLSTTSLFLQRGAPATVPRGTARRVGNGTAWVSVGTPERVVWSSGGFTWTLVSDAPSQVVDDVVQALPHAAPTRPRDSLGGRVWRGMSRVGGWLNPFR